MFVCMHGWMVGERADLIAYNYHENTGHETMVHKALSCENQKHVLSIYTTACGNKISVLECGGAPFMHGDIHHLLKKSNFEIYINVWGKNFIDCIIIKIMRKHKIKKISSMGNLIILVYNFIIFKVVQKKTIIHIKIKLNLSCAEPEMDRIFS